MDGFGIVRGVSGVGHADCEVCFVDFEDVDLGDLMGVGQMGSSDAVRIWV